VRQLEGAPNGDEFFPFSVRPHQTIYLESKGREDHLESGFDNVFSIAKKSEMGHGIPEEGIGA